MASQFQPPDTSKPRLPKKASPTPNNSKLLTSCYKSGIIIRSSNISTHTTHIADLGETPESYRPPKKTSNKHFFLAPQEEEPNAHWSLEARSPGLMRWRRSSPAELSWEACCVAWGASERRGRSAGRSSWGCRRKRGEVRMLGWEKGGSAKWFVCVFLFDLRWGVLQHVFKSSIHLVSRY